MTAPREALAAALILGAGVLVYLLAPILTPFLVSGLLAYILNPAVGRLVRWRVPRTAAVALIFALVLAAVLWVALVLVPVLEHQLGAFLTRLPDYLARMQARLGPWLGALGVAVPDLAALRQALSAHWQELGSWVGVFLAHATRSGLSLLGWVIDLALVPVVTFYALRDWDRILARALDLVPPRLRPAVASAAAETDRVLASFLRGQLSVMLLLGLIYSAGLALVGLDLALPIGLLAGLASFVPYLGLIVGFVSAAVAALLQFQDALVLGWVALVFGVGQVMEAMVLTPWLVGDRIGLHPIAVIFAVLAGGQLFGMVGVLLALPVAAALWVWVRRLRAFYNAPGTAVEEGAMPRRERHGRRSRYPRRLPPRP